MVATVPGARSRRLARAAVLLSITAHAAKALAVWPPSPATPIESLSDPSNWPDDPSYAYSDAYVGRPGQWWLYSFVPTRAPTALLLRQPGLASGVSVDAAWRFGVGSSNVVLAIIDDGVDLYAPELVGAFALNLGELLHAPPLLDGKPCAPLVPGDPSSPRFDCSLPFDGEVTLEDFREFLGFASDGLPKQFRYDPNGNDILDAYDVIQRYQNQRDDDNNGLVDDIIGWNFIGSNPFPVHGATNHGSESALDAVGRANDGIGRAGVCPRCRIIPIRLTDQRGADPQQLALGILYAASRGATAVLVGHLPLGRSEALERAVVSAAASGTLVLFPQDGERQFNAPLHLDHDSWLAVGGLTTSSDNGFTTLTTSFAALDPCQAFAPGANLVGSGPACSRTAPSITLGVSGLVAAAAQKDGAFVRLSPLELAATLKSTADPIDTTLTSPSGSASSAQPILRRLNANTAVESIRAGLVPPELNLERPYWNEPIVLNRQKAPISVVGRLSAVRADSIDLAVSLAHGRNPSETDFQNITAKTGLDKTSFDEEGSLLATVDIRQETLRSPPETKEPRTGAILTLRVKATANYSALSRSVSTSIERKLVLIEDADLLAGAPHRIGSTPTSPKIADVDGNSVNDIVIGTLDGRILSWSVADGRLIESGSKVLQTDPTDGFAALLKPSPPPSMLGNAPSFLSNPVRSSIAAAPAIADLDGDGRTEIIATTLDGRVYAFRADGTSPFSPRAFLELPTPVEPCQGNGGCSSVSSRLERGISASPVVADMNGDGQLEVVVAAHDGRVHVYGSDGKSLPGWPLLIEGSSNTAPGRILHSPAVGDFDGDAVSDLLVTTGEQRTTDFDRGAQVLVLGSKAGNRPRIADGWPVTVESYDIQADRIDRSTPGASIDTSTDPIRAVLYGNASQPFYLSIAPGVTRDQEPSHVGLPSEAKPVSRLDGMVGFDLTSKGVQSALTSTGDFAPLLTRPSLGDLDRDGVIDVVLSGASLGSLLALRNNSTFEHQGMLGMFSGESGRMLPIAPIPLDDFNDGGASAAVADITNDGVPEVIVSNGSTGVIAIDACGRSAPGWPKVLGSRVRSTPAVGDVDNDGRLEVVVTTEDGWLYVWRTDGSANSYVPWAAAYNDNYNQSAYRPPPSTTEPKHTTRVRLDSAGRCDLNDTPPVPPATQAQLSARGGCGCWVPIGHRHPKGWWMVPILAALGLRLRWRGRDGKLPIGAEGRT